MATEIGELRIEIEARFDKLDKQLKRSSRAVSNFEKRSRRGFSRITRSFRRMALKFTGITALIAAAAGAFSFVAFIKGSIDAASAIDTFTIRLQNLIGSAEEANKTIARLRVRATRVAPAFKDLVGATATLGTVALGSSQQMERLTDTALNISAVTGLTLDQAAQNLQRTLSAGIGAADLFRERGVRALVESVTRIPNLIELSFGEVEEAFDRVFGPGGIFKDAADQFAVTLPGKISVTRDALFNLQATLGEALSPTIIATLSEVVIPFFETLEQKVIDNELAIEELAFRGVKAAILAFTGFGKILIEIVRAMSRTGQAARSLTELFTKALIARQRVKAFVAEGATGRIGPRLGALITGEELPITPEQARLNELREILALIQADGVKAEAELAEFDATLAAIGKSLTLLEGLAENFGKESVDAAADSAAAAQEFLAELQALLAGAQRGLDPRLLAQTEAAVKRIRDGLEGVAIASARTKSSFQAEVLELDKEERILRENLALARKNTEAFEARVLVGEKIVKRATTEEQKEVALEKLQGARFDLAQAIAAQASIRAEAAQRLLDIEQKRKDLAVDERETLTDVLFFQDEIKADLEILKTLDQDRTDEFLLQLEALKAQNLEVAEQLTKYEALAGKVKKAREEAEEEISPLAESIASTLGDALRTVFDNLQDPAADFAKFFADISATLLDHAINSVIKGFEKLITDLLKNLSEESEGLVGGILGAAGLAFGLIAGALKETEISTSADKIISAVESAQQVRGIIAGPTQIGIAQVGETIEAAFIETNFILRYGNDLLERILIAMGGSSIGLTEEAVSTTAETAFGATGPSLA